MLTMTYRLLRNMVMMLLLAAVSGNAPAQSLPAKAEVTYRGTHAATVTRKQRQSQRVDLGKVFGRALGGGTGGQRYEGAITITLRIDGAAVTADISGTGGLSPDHPTGLIQAGHCRLMTPSGNEVWEGTCDARGFSGTVKSTSKNRNDVDGHFETATTSIVDITARDARAAAAQSMRDADAAERRRRVEARRAVLKPQCDAKKMSACVELDTLEQE